MGALHNNIIHNYQAGQAPFPLRYRIIRKGEVGWVGAGLILTLQRPRKKLSDFREQIRDYRFWPQEFKTVGIFSISFFLFPRFGIFSIFFNSVRILMNIICHFFTVHS